MKITEKKLIKLAEDTYMKYSKCMGVPLMRLDHGDIDEKVFQEDMSEIVEQFMSAMKGIAAIAYVNGDVFKCVEYKCECLIGSWKRIYEEGRLG